MRALLQGHGPRGGAFKTGTEKSCLCVHASRVCLLVLLLLTKKTSAYKASLNVFNNPKGYSSIGEPWETGFRTEIPKRIGKLLAFHFQISQSFPDFPYVLWAMDNGRLRVQYASLETVPWQRTRMA